MFQRIRTGAPVGAKKTPPIKVVVFSNLLCSYCGQTHQVIKEWQRRYPTQLQVAFDIQLADEWFITVTPAVFINQEYYPGVPAIDLIERYLPRHRD
ncbi:hypothetical protein EBR57_07775 [bacterium]|nr:hypothetical protein [bacterium]